MSVCACSPATTAASMRLRSPPMGACWPLLAKTKTSYYGISPRARSWSTSLGTRRYVFLFDFSSMPTHIKRTHTFKYVHFRATLRLHTFSTYCYYRRCGHWTFRRRGRCLPAAALTRPCGCGTCTRRAALCPLRMRRMVCWLCRFFNFLCAFCPCSRSRYI